MNLHIGLVLFLASFAASAQSNVPSEMAERAVVSAAAGRALMASDFGVLESQARTYLEKRRRTSSGLWKLTLFNSGIIEAINTASKDGESGLRNVEDIIEQWTSRYPDSPSAHIAYARVLIKRAWLVRGGGYANTVKPEAWAPFKRHIAEARDYLEKHKSVAAKDPRWYETMLLVARAESWERKRFDALFDEALRREPLFYQNYFAALEYLLPKWHGDADEIDAFVQDAVRRTASQEGQGMYARSYWYASQAQFDNDLFARSNVDWPRMKAGFDDIIAKYPDAWNLNNYAKFACLARDKAKMLELSSRIGAKFVREAWEGKPSMYQDCIDWAKGGARIKA